VPVDVPSCTRIVGTPRGHLESRGRRQGRRLLLAHLSTRRPVAPIRPGRLKRWFRPFRSVIGCVYIYPDTKGADDAVVASRVRATHAGCDASLRELCLTLARRGVAIRAELIRRATNRPDLLEPALAARPGRIDQAVELPLPDADGRRRLIDLYGEGLELPADVDESLIASLEGVSPAFIRELLRRAALLAAHDSADGALRVGAGGPSSLLAQAELSSAAGSALGSRPKRASREPERRRSLVVPSERPTRLAGDA
jgi:hypothetical protein